MAANQELALAAKKKGNGFYKAKAWDEAIAAYTEAIELDNTNHTFFSNRSACYAGKSDFENSLKDAKKVIEINPKFAKGYTRAGLALLKLEKFEESIEIYKQGMNECPEDAGIRKAFQQALANSGKGMIPKEAMGVILQDKELAGWYTTDADFKSKVDAMMSRFPQQHELMSWLQDPKITKFLQKMRGGEASEAFPEPAAAPSKPKPKPKPEPELSEEEKAELELKKKADSLKLEGTKLYKAKQFIDALKKYEAAAEVCPTEPVYILNQAAVQMMLNQLEDCEKLCLEAIKVARANHRDYKWDAKAYNRLATIEEKRGNLDKALSYLQDSLAEVGDEKVRKRVKALTKTKVKKAKADLLNPEEALEYKAKADAAFKERKWKEAIDLYTESIKRDPKNPKVLNNRSTAYCKLMGWEPALEDVQKAIMLDPSWHKPYLRKVAIEKMLKKYHRALATLKVARKVLAPEFQPQISAAFLSLQQAIGDANNNDDPERIARARQDPEIQRILTDPMIVALFKQQETDNGAIAKAVMKDPIIRDKIEMLAAAGILR